MIAAAFSKQWGKLINDRWQGIPGRYVLMFIGLGLLWEIMQAVYEHDADKQARLEVFDTSPDARRAAATQIEELDAIEKVVLKRMSAVGAMNENHAMTYVLGLSPEVRQHLGPLARNEILGPISRKTNLLIRDMVGNYQINPAFKNALLEMLVD